MLDTLTTKSACKVRCPSHGRRGGRPPRRHSRTVLQVSSSAHPRSHRPHPHPRQALVRAIEALGTVQPSGPSERALARLLMAASKRRLRAIVKVVPIWVSEEILSASEHIGDDRAVLWMSEN
jgi:hypothetical protein